MSVGYIYLITNDINSQKYVGQTSRDIQTRFQEHCFDTRSTSVIHNTIQSIGYQHFSIQLLETVDIAYLDEREKYWINYYDSVNNGYNQLLKNEFNYEQFQDCTQIQIAENNLIFNSAEDLSNQISSLTKWNSYFVQTQIKLAVETNSLFLDYHLLKINCPIEQVSSIEDQENWIKTLNIRYCGQHIYCVELNQNFSTITEASAFLLEHGYYQGKSYTPIQSLITDISKSIKTESSTQITQPSLSFIKIPGYVKDANDDIERIFQDKAIFCPQLELTFPSIKIAGELFAKNKIWGNITAKTAISRIADITRGYFSSYKGYTFFALTEDGQKIDPPLLKTQLPYLLPESIKVEKNNQLILSLQQQLAIYT